MIPQARVSKPMDGLTSRKCRHREENVTLRNVVSQINLSSEKMVANTAKKAAILGTLHQASIRDFASSGETRVPHEAIFEMKSMRKSLQNQLKNDGHKALCPEGKLRQFSTRKPPVGERGSSAISSGRISNASSHTGVVIKRNENEKKNYRKESQGRPSTTRQQMTNRQDDFTRNVYSRHMTTPTPRITVENNAKDDTEIDFKINSQSVKTETETLKKESDTENKSDDSDEVFFSASDARNSALSLPQEDILLEEKEVLNKFTDPQLKESLQNIIKRRRSSVRFVKSESGYDMINLENTISEHLEENADQYKKEQQQQLAESENAVEEVHNSENRSVQSASSRRVSANRERLTSAGTITSEKSHVAANPRQPRTHSRKTGRQEQRIPTARRTSSARSCVSTASNHTQRSLSSPILRRRRPEFQTEETRVIRPATAKGYVPNLTNRKVSRKHSALSCPDILQRRDQAKNLAQVNMIREFLLMYAKVATKKDEALPKSGPVRMMSQTPELVIKSAIGQFLTRAFPSGEGEEWSGLSARSKKERYEEQQRSKLLRIKVCMKHLASVA